LSSIGQRDDVSLVFVRPYAPTFVITDGMDAAYIYETTAYTKDGIRVATRVALYRHSIITVVARTR